MDTTIERIDLFLSKQLGKYHRHPEAPYWHPVSRVHRPSRAKYESVSGPWFTAAGPLGSYAGGYPFGQGQEISNYINEAMKNTPELREQIRAHLDILADGLEEAERPRLANAVRNVRRLHAKGHRDLAAKRFGKLHEMLAYGPRQQQLPLAKPPVVEPQKYLPEPQKYTPKRESYFERLKGRYSRHFHKALISNVDNFLEKQRKRKEKTLLPENLTTEVRNLRSRIDNIFNEVNPDWRFRERELPPEIKPLARRWKKERIQGHILEERYDKRKEIFNLLRNRVSDEVLGRVGEKRPTKVPKEPGWAKNYSVQFEQKLNYLKVLEDACRKEDKNMLADNIAGNIIWAEERLKNANIGHMQINDINRIINGHKEHMLRRAIPVPRMGRDIVAKPKGKTGERIYIKQPGDAPEGVQVQRGRRGGMYYIAPPRAQREEHEKGQREKVRAEASEQRRIEREKAEKERKKLSEEKRRAVSKWQKERKNEVIIEGEQVDLARKSSDELVQMQGDFRNKRQNARDRESGLMNQEADMRAAKVRLEFLAQNEPPEENTYKKAYEKAKNQYEPIAEEKRLANEEGNHYNDLVQKVKNEISARGDMEREYAHELQKWADGIRDIERMQRAAEEAKEALAVADEHDEFHSLMSPMSKQTTQNAGINGSYILTLKNGKKGLFKPSNEERDARRDIKTGTYYKREMAACLLDRELGWNYCPDVTIINHKNKGVGSIQEWIDDAEVGKEPGDYDSKDTERMAIYNFIMLNEDRHGSNYLTKDNRPVAIDNGLAFGTEPKSAVYRTKFGQYWTGRKISDDVKDDVRKLSTNDRLRKDLSRLLEPEAIKHFYNRVEEVLEVDVLPRVPQGAGTW